MLDSIALTAAGDKKGQKPQAGVIVADPGDYKLVYTAIAQIMAFLRSIPGVNIIVTAHIVGKWGKAHGAGDYDDKVLVGEQLALTDKLADQIPGNFDHIYRFEKVDTGTDIQYLFSAQSDLARSSYPIPYGQHDITSKSFYSTLMQYVKSSSPQLGEVKL
jgi:hypothetical protein